MLAFDIKAGARCQSGDELYPRMPTAAARQVGRRFAMLVIRSLWYHCPIRLPALNRYTLSPANQPRSKS